MMILSHRCEARPDSFGAATSSHNSTRRSIRRFVAAEVFGKPFSAEGVAVYPIKEHQLTMYEGAFVMP